MGFKNYFADVIGVGFGLARAEFKLRNEGTWLGVFWYLLSPIFTFIIMYGVFSNNLGSSISNYPLYLFIGILMFNFFNLIATESTYLIFMHAGIIRSISFKKESLVIKAIIKILFIHTFEFLVLIIFLLLFGISLSTIIYYPLILLLVVLFSYGVSLILSSIAIYCLDLRDLWSFASRLIWFATPIIYMLEPGSKLVYFNYFNPMYYFITFTRELVIYNRFPETFIILGSIGYVFLSMIVGTLIFKLLSRRISELV